MEPISSQREISLNLLRIVTGLLFVPHGAMKLFGYPGHTPAHPLSLFSLFGLAGILEFFGGLAILFGFFTRPVAFVLCGEMAVAYWIAHGRRALLPIVNKGELAVLFCFVFLFLSANGGGRFSIEGWLRSRRRG
jgi:putative oxidoreductase